MAERKVKVPGPAGDLVDGWEVPVEESTERWSEIKLEDGTVMRVKMSIASAVRIDGQYDDRGNPIYVVQMAPSMALVDSPPQLRKKVQ